TITVRSKHKIIWATASAIIIANIALTHHFYHNLLKYQAGSVIGKYIRKHNIPPEKIIYTDFNCPLKAIHFYANKVLFSTKPPLAAGSYLITGEAIMDTLTNSGLRFDTLQTGFYQKISMIDASFLNPKTREKALSHYFFVCVR